MIEIERMNLKSMLFERIGIREILEIKDWAQGDGRRKQALYDLLLDDNDLAAYQAAWVMTHFSSAENEWLYDKHNALIDEALVCQHPGRRRLLLSLLFRQPMSNPPRTDFLDFCLERMISKQELPGVQSLAMKLAYELCRPFPELLQELKLTLEIMEPDLLQISLKTVRKNILKAMRTGKSLQSC